MKIFVLIALFSLYDACTSSMRINDDMIRFKMYSIQYSPEVLRDLLAYFDFDGNLLGVGSFDKSRYDDDVIVISLVNLLPERVRHITADPDILGYEDLYNLNRRILIFLRKVPIDLNKYMITLYNYKNVNLKDLVWGIVTDGEITVLNYCNLINDKYREGMYIDSSGNLYISRLKYENSVFVYIEHIKTHMVTHDIICVELYDNFHTYKKLRYASSEPMDPFYKYKNDCKVT